MFNEEGIGVNNNWLFATYQGTLRYSQANVKKINSQNYTRKLKT